MTTNTFGEVSWDSSDFGDKKVNSKDLFLRLDDGDNEVRLVTAPYQYLVHRYKKEGDPGFGQKVQCSASHGSCPLCDTGDKAKRRWLLGVIERKKGTYKILDISYAVFGQIQKYAKNAAHWGDPTKYDLNIVVDKNGGATGYYSVQPVPKSPLSATDQDIKDKADLDDLKRRVTPPDAATVQRRLDKINGAVVPGSNGSTVKTAVKSTPAVSLAADEEMDAEFPDYNGTTA
jgi:hypothetical protein